MNGRLQGKIAIIVGAGQSPGETIGNGRAMAILFARHGAQVLCSIAIWTARQRPRR
jgi:NAD(P)-dependent dehydrogenase (short-subunit alcohol dehydrogenase family)